METIVLCPHQITVTSHKGEAGEQELSLKTVTRIEKGEKFYPWNGVLKSETMENVPILSQFDIKQRYGAHDEVKETSEGLKRRCNWIRFLKVRTVMSSEVNIIGMKNALGEPVLK